MSNNNLGLLSNCFDDARQASILIKDGNGITHDISALPGEIKVGIINGVREDFEHDLDACALVYEK